jgi:hypothetical protein
MMSHEKTMMSPIPCEKTQIPHIKILDFEHRSATGACWSATFRVASHLEPRSGGFSGVKKKAKWKITMGNHHV